MNKWEDAIEIDPHLVSEYPECKQITDFIFDEISKKYTIKNKKEPNKFFNRLLSTFLYRIRVDNRLNIPEIKTNTSHTRDMENYISNMRD